MSSSIWTCVSAILAALAASLPGRAAAQACCGGPTAFAPARLAPHEDALVGVQAKVSRAIGSFDARGRFDAAPAGTAEVDLEQDLVAAARVLRHGQLSLVLPMIETWRAVPGRAEAGGDLGDLQLGARWDFTVAGEHPVVPGIAFSFGAVLPTGRPPERAAGPLATDATGTGTLQLAPALAVEQAFGPWIVNVTGAIAWRGPHTVGGIRAQQGPSFAASATGAHVFAGRAIVALTATYDAGLDARVDGAAVPDSHQATTRLALAGGLQFPGGWRVQGTVFGDLPVRWLGHDRPAAVGLAFVLVRGSS